MFPECAHRLVSPAETWRCHPAKAKARPLAMLLALSLSPTAASVGRPLQAGSSSCDAIYNTIEPCRAPTWWSVTARVI